MRDNRLTKTDIRTMSLSALGGALEFYDFIIYVFFAAAISKLFFPANMPEWLKMVQTFGIFAAGYLARPLGGVIIAHFGDLLGRKRMFMLSVFLMTVPTLLIGLMPTYAQIGLAAPLLLLLFRIMQGAAVGGEVPGAWVFVAEHVPKDRVGLACGVLTAGLTFGILLGSLIATVITKVYGEAKILEFAWRIPFIFGGVFGLLAVWLRSFLHETPVFQKMQAEQNTAKELPVKTVVKQHGGAVALTMIFTWFISAAIVVVILMTPSIFQTHMDFGIPAAFTQPANVVATITLTIGCVFFGFLADKLNVGAVISIGAVLLAVVVGMFYRISMGSIDNLILIYGICGFFVGVVGAVPSVCVKAFPAAIRFSGLSFAYNVAYAIFGGLTPVLVSLLAAKGGMMPAYYVAFVCLLTAALGLYVMAHKDRLNKIHE